MKEKIKRKLKMWAVCGVLLTTACVGVSKVVTVTNTVNGKELPIYSVETDEKKAIATVIKTNQTLLFTIKH